MPIPLIQLPHLEESNILTSSTTITNTNMMKISSSSEVLSPFLLTNQLQQVLNQNLNQNLASTTTYKDNSNNITNPLHIVSSSSSLVHNKNNSEISLIDSMDYLDFDLSISSLDKHII